MKLNCQPNEKEGKFLLNEIMQAGNFGRYDDRIARGAKRFMGSKVSSSISHAIEKQSTISVSSLTIPKKFSGNHSSVCITGFGGSWSCGGISSMENENS